MSEKHNVKQGDCIDSIAFSWGFFPETIWNDSANADLKNLRKDPNVLLANDVVVIPDKQEKEVAGATEQRHRFRRKGVPETFTLVLEEGGEPRADEPYVLWIDGKARKGKTDEDGALTESISPSAKQGRLVIGEEEEGEILLDFGFVDPIEELSGVQGRLRNLGLYDGPLDGKPSDDTTTAIAKFQASVGLKEDGQLDDDRKTRDALLEEHGS